MSRTVSVWIGLVLVIAMSDRVGQAQTHAPWPSDWNNWNDPALWVDVGDAGNAGEWSGAAGGGNGQNRICGAVSYEYRIGKYEVTAGQYCEFLNAVAKTDTYKLYSLLMTNLTSFYGCNIQRSGSPGTYTYSVAPDWANRPVGIVTWAGAARFANWLTNGQPTGAQDLTTTEDGSYFLNGATTEDQLVTVTRKNNARYVIPSEDEWYKAAYCKGSGTNTGYWDYPTRSDAAPANQVITPDPGNSANFALNWPSDPTIGGPYWRTEVGEFESSPSPYGAFDMGGNVDEWNEEIMQGRYRASRGGSFVGLDGFLARDRAHYLNADCNASTLGFRLAEVPEPATVGLLAMGLCVLFRRKPKSRT